MQTDSLDRFGTKIEHRFTKDEIYTIKKLLENEIDSFLSTGIEWLPIVFIEVNSNPGLIGIEKTFSKDFSITEEILKTYMDRTNWS